MQPFQCDLQPQLQETHRTTHTGSTIVAKHIEGTKRPQPQPPHTRGTFHRRLQPLYTEKHKVSCSGFLPNSPLPFLTASHRHHFPSSPPPFVHFPSSPLPFLTTSHRPHLPSSPFPFIITSLRHHFPSYHFPSSPLPFVTTSHRHHFPSSPLPFVTTSLRHHPSLSPPFIKVNSTASYSFVMYCYVMYCYVIYHPASFQVAEFYLSVTRKYCFPTSFDEYTIPSIHLIVYRKLCRSARFPHPVTRWRACENSRTERLQIFPAGHAFKIFQAEFRQGYRLDRLGLPLHIQSSKEKCLEYPNIPFQKLGMRGWEAEQQALAFLARI